MLDDQLAIVEDSLGTMEENADSFPRCLSSGGRFHKSEVEKEQFFANLEHKGRDEITLPVRAERLESGMCLQSSCLLKIKAFPAMLT